MGSYSATPAHRTIRYLLLPLAFSATILALAGCGQKSEAPQKARPLPTVSIYQVEQEEIGEYREFVARTEAHQEAEITARVSGELIERTFKEGSHVDADQLLLTIDDSEYQSSVTQARADLKSRIAQAKSADRDLKRGKEIASDGYISQSDLDKLTTAKDQADAGVVAAQAALEKAELNLSYTKIKAPFDGRIGKVKYNVGNVVGPQSGALATITSVNPIYVNFQIEEADFVSYLQSSSKSKAQDVDLTLRLPNNTDYGVLGEMNFADTKIDESTGTVELRATFENANKVIVPGLFVTLIIESRQKQKMSWVPQAAVQENQQGKFVLVVNENDEVAVQPVKLGRRVNAMWVVESGLNEGDKVIIEGLQKVRQGTKVAMVNKSVDPLTGVFTQASTEK